MVKPPLFDLFILMRDSAGLPLTIEQYHSLRQALKGGFGISNRDELKQICRLLWIKSNKRSQVERFEKCFEQYFAKSSEDLEPQNKPTSSNTKTQKQEQTTSNPTKKTSETKTLESNKKPSQTSPQIVKAVRLGGKLLPEKLFNQKQRFRLTLPDFPATRRKIQQNWRYVVQFERELKPLCDL